MNRTDLAQRQHDVLATLLRHEVPDGFDARSAGLTSRVLAGKRRSDAVLAVPDLRLVDDLATRFTAWAAAHPRHGCGHEDALEFVVADDDTLPEPLASVRSVERVYRRTTSHAYDRRPGHRRFVIGVGGRVWHVGPRSRTTG